MVLPPGQSESQPSNAKLALLERKRPLPPDRIQLNSYLPPRGPTLAMEEVTTADCLDDLYPRTLQMPVIAQEAGLGEEYFKAVPVGTIKEDIQQIVQDGMQIHNRNYVQSTELVK